MSNEYKLKHRDIKPGNVLIINGQPKISDFGMSKFLADSSYLSLKHFGTPAYTAP